MLNNLKISLHLGVHKTATTYIQSRLYNSRDLLSENGVLYIPLGEIRELVTTRLNKKKYSSQDILESLKPYMECDHLVLSDENILGGTNKPINGSIYQNAQRRLKRLLTALDGYDVDVFITLRDYPDYFVSRYAEFLRHFPFIGFEDYYQDVDFESVSWLEVIDSIKTAGSRKIIITDFKVLFDNEQAYLDQMLGQRGIILESADDKSSVRRAKFTQQGYEVIKFYAKNYSPGSAKKIMHIIGSSHQETPKTVFMPFSEEQREQLSTRYLEELATLNQGADDSVMLSVFD